MLAYTQSKQRRPTGTHGVLCLVAEGLMVEVVFTVTRSHALQVGDVASDLLDGLHLLTEELGLNEVGHLYVK